MGGGDPGAQAEDADCGDQGPDKLVLQVAVRVLRGRRLARTHDAHPQQDLPTGCLNPAAAMVASSLAARTMAWAGGCWEKIVSRSKANGTLPHLVESVDHRMDRLCENSAARHTVVSTKRCTGG